MKRHALISLVILLVVVFITACKDDEMSGQGNSNDLTQYPYQPTAYTIVKPAHYPDMPIPADNPMSKQGVQLGRMLFYDPILSGDSTQSCSTCHLPLGSFTDNLAVSKGIDGLLGKRSAMSLLNIGFNPNAMFWDGRSPNLEDQALRPVEDPIEMHNTWTKAIDDLKKHQTYPRMFREAFGINDKTQITKELAAKAIAQFERILVSSGTSKYDQFMATNDPNVLDDEEFDGMVMYFDRGVSLGISLPDAECFHCHGGPLATTNNFFNNGLQEAATLADFQDKGQGGFLGNPSRNGFFRAPSLINIALTAPYFHNGSAKNLDEVINHYSMGGKASIGKDPFIHKLGVPPNQTGLTPYQKTALIKFLLCMTDTIAIKNPDIQNPF